MLDCVRTFDALRQNDVRFFAGVPDSLLKHLCACIQDRCAANDHVITPNEGNAVALVAGHHLATGELGLVYMQNSGLGNAVNPLVSLAGAGVYSIPMLLLIGWRGEPGRPDEPQHLQQGQVTLGLLEQLEIPHLVLPDSEGAAQRALLHAAAEARRLSAPFAIVVRKGTFADYAPTTPTRERYSMGREEVVQQLLASLEAEDAVVSTTGKTSREVFEYRAKHDEPPRDFLTVGSMGHASQIALGVALARRDRRVVCLDGDGAALMHMGSLAAIGQSDARNLVHVVLNNGAHDSVGGQPTVGFGIDIAGIAAACGYSTVHSVATASDLHRAWVEIAGDGPHFLEVRVKRGARSDLGRPTSTPAENKGDFMQFIAASHKQAVAAHSEAQ
ncbi:MAG: phosphonopyruvate decarboxylase [Planctomycetota bacterium]